MYIAAAVLLDALFGDSKKIPHPVAGIGFIIRFLEARLYHSEDKKRAGVKLCLAVLAITGAATWAILALASLYAPACQAAVLYLLYSALAWRSLKDETLPVALSLFAGDLPGARQALSHVVGRDVESLNEEEIACAAIETIGENFIDGVFSVLFFAALGYFFYGPTGAVILAWLFKAASTMDSMIGYDDEKYRGFGRASAKLDDALNFVPARLGGVIIILAGACLALQTSSKYSPLRALRIFLRDRKKHKSPNSAHGESAFAGLLGVKLGGGAAYGGVFAPRPEIGDVPDAAPPRAEDILRAHSILDASAALCAIILLALFGTGA